MGDMNDFNRQVIEEFRANNGVVGGGFEGMEMSLVTTIGAKSGATRINPLVSLTTDDGHLYVFASRGGADVHPDWFHNLVANPAVTVEHGNETYQATAVEITGAERDRIYALQAARYPQFQGYEEMTERVIPVVELVPVS